MVWIEIAEVQAEPDRSFHSGMAHGITNDLAHAYEQSGFDLFAQDLYSPYSITVILGQEKTWLWLEALGKLPIPARPGRSGVTNQIQATFQSDRTGGAGTAYARLYLLGANGNQAIDPTEGVPGEESYDEKGINGISGWQPLLFDPVYPRRITSLSGGSPTIPGLVIPVVWLRVAVWAEYAQTIRLRGLRIREIPE